MINFLPVQQKMDIIDWAESRVVLPQETYGLGAGPLKIRKWQIKILRTIQYRKARRVTICVNARAGKSTIALITMGHNICTDQVSMLFMLPTRALIDDWNNQKLLPFLDRCAEANALVVRNRNNALSNAGINYVGGAGRINYRTGRSAAAFNQLNAAIAWIDEVDHSDVAAKDGSYADMLHARGEDSIDPIWIESGTPSVKHESASEKGLLISDYNDFWLDCVHCPHQTRLTLEQANRVHLPKTGENPYLQHCESCHAPLMEDELKFMLEADGSDWIPRNSERSDSHSGFHLNAFYSYDLSVDEIMSTYNPEDGGSLRGFYTQKLALTPPEIEIPQMHPDEMKAFMKPAPTELPLLKICVGVDTQYGHDARLESSIIEYYGDPYNPHRHVRRKFVVSVIKDDWLRAIQDHKKILNSYRPDFVGYDIGGNLTNNAEKLKSAIERVWGTDFADNKVKCLHGTGTSSSEKWKDLPAIKNEKTQETTTNPRATLVVYSSIIKTRLFEATGLFHSDRISFEPDDHAFPSEYWDQLCGEEMRRSTKRRGNVEVDEFRWVPIKSGQRVEALDEFVYAEVGSIYLGPDYRRSAYKFNPEYVDKILGKRSKNQSGKIVPKR